MKAPLFPLFFLLFASLLTLNCQTNVLAQTVQQSPPAKKKNTLVGKTITQIKQMGYYNCMGSALSDVPGGILWYSVHWAPDNNSCFSGKSVFTFEKVLSGNGQFPVNRVVVAELVVDYGAEERDFIMATLSLNDGPKRAYVVQHTSKGYGTVSGVQKLWHLNLTTQRFESVAVPANLSFPHPYHVESEF